MSEINTIRTSLRQILWQDEFAVLEDLIKRYAPDDALRRKIEHDAISLVSTLRHDSTPALMEIFMAEYGLSTQEGVALMCLAEALLRVPDAHTIDDLIEDKIAPSEWGKHLGQSASALVNASTWGLLLTGKVLADEPRKSVSGYLHQAVKRLGEPVIRAAVTRAMKELGQQFVLGETIESAWKRGSKMMDKGYTYSFDMLGEAARTQEDADAYFEAYKAALTAIAKRASANDVAENPGISIKLSALHPRYESLQYRRVLSELSPKVLELCQLAASANIGLNIDAEEADRLDLSLDVIEQVLSDHSLASWEGFGVVVQAYGKRASATVDWLYQLASDLDRKLMIRLVKGAYWDTEIKLAQVEGLSAFPLFTQKASTDAAYICIAKQLLSKSDRLYSQFATHNAHTVCSVIQLADVLNTKHYEFQRLHGMGETLHNVVMSSHKTRCRIYAPVGSHKDLLAYLVRRLLENGANSSFVSQIVNQDISAAAIAADPFKLIEHGHTPVTPPAALFGERKNAQGWNLFDPIQRHVLLSMRDQFAETNWQVASICSVDVASAETHTVVNPADLNDTLGSAALIDDSSIANVIEHTQTWRADAAQRASSLRAAADLYEQHTGEIVAILQREAGKTIRDAIAEIREAVDFLRYYADQSLSLERDARGIMVCISPWNFPLAIFTGQIAAALAAGNGVIAKPAESTNIIAVRAVQWLHEAGVPADCLQLVLGTGQALGHSLCSHPAVAGVCFTGSTPTAQRINQTMAAHLAPSAPLIAETGGLNAMIVDSTALPEQVVRDVMISAFQSAGQRCSALRMLYIQEDVYEQTLEMLIGAMKCWYVGDPWDLSTDAGPLINAAAHQKIEAYITTCRDRGQLRFQSEPVSSSGYTLPATLIEVSGIEALSEEIFGP
ncbi:MAG: bifunctional proline dehydrogenase/L-glutamate gamma-semialdehyde dehydrogenase PutA, partial [Gammaproteobacteria bacterium]|nr:bifunctional proline dehydrogenase/L-glutamate gamma-semialdehyde dehydrogenase PutA [Gammaproteobacteria bacterium]